MAGSGNRSVVWFSRAVLLSFAVAMFIATWAGWPDLIVDCGREMYVPAAMVHGKTLYRDVWYPYGPLAPFVNAALFGVFGISLNTLYFSGLVVFSGSALVLHSIALRFVPPLAALLCGLAFLAPGFQPSYFNDILPYSCAATLGALLCLLTLLCLLRHLEQRAGPNLVLAGIFAALAVLSKLELMLPCAAGLVLALLLQDRAGKGLPAHLQSNLLQLLPGIALCGGLYGWLVYREGLEFLIDANWMSAPGSYFMQRYGALWMSRTGFRAIPSETAGWIGRAITVPLLWWICAFFLRRRPWVTVAAVALSIPFLLPSAENFIPFLGHPISGDKTVAWLISNLIDDLAFPRGMFLVAVIFAGVLITQAVRQRQSRSAGLLVTIAMALTLALRIMMEVRPVRYAIYSSSILFLVFVIVLWRIVDRVSADALPRARAFSVAAYFAIYGLVFARMASTLYPGLPWPLIHTPMGDVGRTPEHIALVSQFLPVVQQARSRGERVLLLPELTGLYFIAGIESPSRYEVLTPGVLSPGKYTDAFLNELARTPPGLIVLSNRRTEEYGVNYFGLDYDRKVLEWIESHYRVTGEIGHFERRADAPLAALLYTPAN